MIWSLFKERLCFRKPKMTSQKECITVSKKHKNKCFAIVLILYLDFCNKQLYISHMQTFSLKVHLLLRYDQVLGYNYYTEAKYEGTIQSRTIPFFLRQNKTFCGLLTSSFFPRWSWTQSEFFLVNQKAEVPGGTYWWALDLIWKALASVNLV